MNEELKEERVLKKTPRINVITKDEFEERTQEIFHILWDALSKSFGPYGAPTLIYNYPFSHITKDGYTIMKNISFDTQESMLDQAIANMAEDICGRLNYTVGDGTTTAVISTNSIYQNYLKNRDSLTKKFVMPRDVIKKYNIIKENIISSLQKLVKPIRSNDPEVLRENIYNVVYVSSNADELITSYIADLYKELGCPAISCELASDGITKMKLINGYKFDMSIMDKLYVNSDDNVMKLNDADIIIFSTKVTKDVYTKILVPLNEACRLRGRHLIVGAPYYDEVALQQIIRRDLTNEYKSKKDVNMVLTNYNATSSHARRLVDDFSVLTNTIVIDRMLLKTIMEDINTNKIKPTDIFNIDKRNIPGTKCYVYSEESNRVGFCDGADELPDGFRYDNQPYEHSVTLGYAKNISLGLKKSIFENFFYDEDRFNLSYNDAKSCLEEAEKKYQKLGTFNIEVSQCQKRFYGLNLKMGLIEVGADTELSQKMIKDSVDDAIRAAASAYDHGVILGCNVNLIQIINELLSNVDKNRNDVEYTLYNILYEGFCDVYRTVLGNAFNNWSIYCPSLSEFEFDENDVITDGDLIDSSDKLEQVVIYFKDIVDSCIGNADYIFDDNTLLFKSIEYVLDKYGKIDLFNVIIKYSLLINKVFDVANREYTDKVINSTQTDEEILKATIDLISLLIVGNQMVVTQRHNFE